MIFLYKLLKLITELLFICRYCDINSFIIIIATSLPTANSSCHPTADRSSVFQKKKEAEIELTIVFAWLADSQSGKPKTFRLHFAPAPPRKVVEKLSRAYDEEAFKLKLHQCRNWFAEFHS